VTAVLTAQAVTIDEVRKIVHLGERFGVRNIRVFGSVARDGPTQRTSRC
jgi:predicted nucleotidyltransferase